MLEWPIEQSDVFQRKGVDFERNNRLDFYFRGVPVEFIGGQRKNYQPGAKCNRRGRFYFHDCTFGFSETVRLLAALCPAGFLACSL
jgi:hypothetical protein